MNGYPVRPSAGPGALLPGQQGEEPLRHDPPVRSHRVRHERESTVPRRPARHRLALAVCGAVAGAAGLLSAVAAGLLPMSVAMTGPAFRMTADEIRLRDVTLLPIEDGPTGRWQTVAMAREGTLTGLCQSLLVSTPAGTLTVRLTTRGPVEASSVVVAPEGRDTVLELTDTDSLLTAGEMRVRDLRTSARSISSGDFRMTDVHLSVARGSHACP